MDLVLSGELGQPQPFFDAAGGLVPPAILAKTSSRWELAAVALMNLPRSVGERLDASGPVLFVGLGPPAKLVTVVAARVQSGEEIVALLTQGASPPRRAVRRADGVVLLPTAEGAAPAPALAVVDRFVVSSPSADALERAAAYAVRGLAPDRARERGLRFTLPKAALSGPLRALIAERWSASRAELERAAAELARERGRAADFAEPGAVLALLDGVVARVGDVLASSASLSVALVPFDDRLELTLELEPDRAGAAAELAKSLRPESLAPLAELPAESAAALLLRPSPGEADVSRGSKPDAAVRSLFGSRLTARDAVRVSLWLARAARNSPAARALALLGDRTVVYREARGPSATGTDLAAAVALLELPALAEPFTALFGKRAPEWTQAPRDATLAVGPSARTVIDTAAGRAPPQAGLALSPALRARHEPAALALHVELSRLGLGSAQAPLFLSLTRGSRAITLRLELSRGASHALLERILSR